MYRILVIDNDLEYSERIKEFLQTHTENVQIYHSKNLSEEQKIYDDIDIVLLNVSLSGKDAEMLIVDALNKYRDKPIILLTNYENYSIGVKSLSQGIADNLLRDDLTADMLQTSINYCLERAKAIVALVEYKRSYDNLFHLSPLPMWIYDVNTLQILDVNSAAIQHYGFSYSEFLNMTIAEIRPEEEIPRMMDAVNYARLKKRLYNSGIFKHRKKNGDVIYMDIRSNDIEFFGKKARVILANDITERLNYIDTIEAQNRSLQEIASILSHDVRAPLAQLMGLTLLIKDKVVNNENSSEVIDKILSSANELDNVLKLINMKTAK